MNGQQFEMGVFAVRAFAGKVKRVVSEALEPVVDAFDIEYYELLLDGLREDIPETAILLEKSRDAEERSVLDAKLKRMILQRNEINRLILQIGDRAAKRKRERQGRED